MQSHPSVFLDFPPLLFETVPQSLNLSEQQHQKNVMLFYLAGQGTLPRDLKAGNTELFDKVHFLLVQAVDLFAEDANLSLGMPTFC